MHAHVAAHAAHRALLAPPARLRAVPAAPGPRGRPVHLVVLRRPARGGGGEDAVYGVRGAWRALRWSRPSTCDTGRRRISRPFGRLEADDHNNPSLVAFRGRIFAFSSPHSGYHWPRDRESAMRYRSTARPWARGGGWDEERIVPMDEGCGLGYTARPRASRTAGSTC